jgi:hypothetical protein
MCIHHRAQLGVYLRLNNVAGPQTLWPARQPMRGYVSFARLPIFPLPAENANARRQVPPRQDLPVIGLHRTQTAAAGELRCS